MNYRFGFGDEAGSVGGKPEAGDTVHFAAVLLLTNNPDELRNYVRRFRDEKRIRDNADFKFNSSPDENRISFLKGLAELDFVARAVVVDKRTLAGEIRLKGLDFYLHFWTMMLRWLFKDFDHARIVLDEYGGPATTVPALMRRLRSEVGIYTPGPCLAIPIRAARSNLGLGIEAADMVAGSIFRIAEQGDARFYRLIRSHTWLWRPVENENPPG